jgi:mevalonate kinase
MQCNNEIIYQSSAKVILSGEHSVVYGYEALCAALSLKTKLTIKVAVEPKNDLEIFSNLGNFSYVIFIVAKS